MPNKYPGKKQSEALVRPFARRGAEGIIRQNLISALGWITMRRLSSRRELVDRGAVARSASYRYERLVEEMFRKPVDEVTDADIAQWVKGPEEAEA